MINGNYRSIMQFGICLMLEEKVLGTNLSKYQLRVSIHSSIAFTVSV